MTEPIRLSIVIVAYDMEVALPRTLRSLSPDQQRGIDAADYELIVVDDGSPRRPNEATLRHIAPNVRLIQLDGRKRSPAHALNVGATEARGDVLGLMIDGSHIATPRALGLGLRVVTGIERATAFMPAFNLGWDAIQSYAVEAGYDYEREEALLAGVDWMADAYQLFNVSAPMGINPDAWIGPFAESNLFFVSTEMWTELRGVDERFDLPGGGLALPDLVERTLALPGAQSVTLLGEATFHQLHGDLSRRAPQAVCDFRRVQREQYAQIRGRQWQMPVAASRMWIGSVPKPARPILQRASTPPYSRSVTGDPPMPQTGPRLSAAIAELDGPTRAVIVLAQRKCSARQFEAAAAVCRAARRRVGDVPALMSILAATSPWLPLEAVLSTAVEAQIHVAVAETMEILAEPDEALREFEAASELDPSAAALFGVARTRLPGPSYTHNLTNFHRHLRPRIYLEIGVDRGRTFALAEPPTLALGVDPQPTIEHAFHTKSQLYEETSDDFFATDAPAVLADERLDFAFIDGLHLFEQSLRDFANVERWSHPGTVVVMHDTIPLDEMTQRREMLLPFWTGDVWKFVVLLAERRPELTIATIPTSPSGLTMIANLDARVRLEDWADSGVVEQYGALDFATSQERLAAAQRRIENSWSAVLDQLEAIKTPAVAQ